MLLRSVLAFLSALLIAGPAAAVDPTDKCVADKIKEAGKYSMCLLNAESKAIKKGLETPDFLKCDSKLNKKWTKIENKGGQACPTLGDEIPLAEHVNSDAAVIVAGLLGGASPIGDGAFDTEYDLLSIEPNDPRTIWVEATDATGNAVGFTAAADDGSCATVLADPNADSITVTGVGEHCEETITLTSDTDATKTLTIKVYDPMVMDIGGGLLIKYVNHYRWKWSPAYTAGPQATTFLHPVTEAGWYPLGSLIIDNHCDGSGYNCFEDQGEVDIPLVEHPMIVVKQADPNASDPPLAAPSTYTQIWYCSTGSYPGAVWKAVCPNGYKAIGMVVSRGSIPSSEAMRCVKEDYTIQARVTVGGEIVSDATTNCPGELSAWEIDEPLTSNSALLNVGTVMGCGGYDSGDCDDDYARLALVPIEPAEQSDHGLYRPTISEGGTINQDVSYAASVRVPFTLIPMLDCEHPIGETLCELNVESSPFYRIKRADEYTLATSFNNLSGPLLQEDVISQTLESSWESGRSETFSMELGISFTAGGSASFFGSGVNWSVNVSTTFGWDTTVTSTYGEGLSTTFEVDVPAYTNVVIARTTARLWAYSEDPGGPNLVSVLGEQNSFADGIRWIYLQYPPAF